jgi:hypothetical protein
MAFTNTRLGECIASLSCQRRGDASTVRGWPEKSGRDEPIRASAELIVHRRDGQIARKNSYARSVGQRSHRALLPALALGYGRASGFCRRREICAQ